MFMLGYFIKCCVKGKTINIKKKKRFNIQKKKKRKGCDWIGLDHMISPTSLNDIVIVKHTHC